MCDSFQFGTIFLFKFFKIMNDNSLVYKQIE